MLYLGGGGSEDDESQLWDLVFRPGQVVAVWPFAMPPVKVPGTMAWWTQALKKRGEFEIKIGDHEPALGLETADVLAISGGNTFHLLAWVQKNKLQPAVEDFIDRGGKIYGGSAGAILLGADIAICDIKTGGMDENDIDLPDTKGFDLLNGAVVFPHFEPDNDSHGATCQRWANEHNVTVIATPEKSGVAFTREVGFLNSGPDDVVTFSPRQEPKIHIAGATFMIERY